MGKHLAPKKKHELNFIKRIPKRVIGPEQAAHVLREETDETPEAGAHAVREQPDAAPVRAAHVGREENRQKPEKTAGPKLQMPKLRIPALGRHPWIFYVLAVILLIVIRFLPLEGWKVPAAYAIPALLCLPEHVLNAWERFRRGDRLNGSLIACLAAVLLFLTGMYPEAVLLLILTFAISFAEKLLLDRSNAEHNTLSQILPGAVQLVTEEGTERVDPAAVQPGDIILVPAGERIPLDGVVFEGITTIDTAAVSGQRSPWAVNVGYKVYAGCRNLTSDIKVRVSRPFEQSTANKILRVSESAPGFVSEQESFAQRFSRIYTPAVLGLALVVGVIIPAFRGGWIVHAQRAAAGVDQHGGRAGHGAFDIAGGQAADNGAEKAACYGAGRCRARHRVFVFPELLDRPVALGIVVHLGHRAAIAACAAGQGESHREKGGTAYGRESGFHTTLRIKFAARAYGLSENGRSRTSDFGKFSTAVPERQEDGFSFPWRHWSSPGRVRYVDPRLIRQGSTAAL